MKIEKYSALIKKLEQEFDSTIWQRGKDYYHEGLVRNVVKEKNQITAQCKGNSLYHLKIKLSNGEMSCSCPCDFTCKHLAALVMWLEKNKPYESAQLESQLSSLSKQELIIRLKIILERNPDQRNYFSNCNPDEVHKLIKKLWIPREEYTDSFFNQINYIKEQIWLLQNPELAAALLRRLIDMRDHDPESPELDHELCTFLESAKKAKFITLTRKRQMNALIEDYPFDDYQL
ncbi:MAG TPA: hypothetical protein VJJ82_00115 [Candidatus Nanoarchaeia archaeon]|nr:hypothetical protein [Candidatus Nanoarchaeia archaeon]